MQTYTALRLVSEGVAGALGLSRVIRRCLHLSANGIGLDADAVMIENICSYSCQT